MNIVTLHNDNIDGTTRVYVRATAANLAAVTA